MRARGCWKAEKMTASAMHSAKKAKLATTEANEGLHKRRHTYSNVGMKSCEQVPERG